MQSVSEQINLERDDAPGNKYLTFCVDEEVYAIELSRVIEIIRMQRINSVPNVPRYVRGLINLRGRVVPVMDIRLRLGLRGRECDERTCIVVVRDASMTVGIVVDRVAGVLDIAPDRIETTSPAACGPNAFISGLAKIDREVKILLDVERVVRDEQMQSSHALAAI